MEPIKNLTVYLVKSDTTTTLIKDQSIEKHSAYEPIILFANVSSGWPITYTFTVDEHVSDTVTHDKDRITISLPNAGEWKINVLAENGISSEGYTITVDVIGGCEPSVEVYDRRKRNEPFQTYLGNDIRINTHEVFYNDSCAEPKDCWKYNWTLYDVTRQVPSTVDYEKHKKFFYIERGLINVPGLYKVEMTAVCNETQSDDKTYFNLTASDPVPIILGKVFELILFLLMVVGGGERIRLSTALNLYSLIFLPY
jgi:hypothetical protein